LIKLIKLDAGNNIIVESPALEIDSGLYFSLSRKSPEIVY